MKRVRSEQMQTLILSYLNKRNYTDSEGNFKSQLKFEESLKEMSSRGSANAEICRGNAVALTVYSIDEYFTVFFDFINFIEKASSSDKGLLDLLYPVFCHLYIDLVSAGRKSDAGMFLGHFQHKISTSHKNELISLSELSQVIQSSDLSSSKKIMDFRNEKYVINIWKDSHSLLLKYLSKSSSLLIMKIVNFHIHFQLTDGASLFDLFTNPFIPKNANGFEDLDKKPDKQFTKKKSNNEESIPKQEIVTLSAPSLMSPPTPISTLTDPAQPFIPEVDRKILLSSIKSVTDSKPSLGNIILHRLKDITTKGLTHVTFSNACNAISAGFEDSSAMLWSFRRNYHCPSSSIPNSPIPIRLSKPHIGTPTHNETKKLTPDVSKVHLGCDYFENIKNRLESPSSPGPEKCLRAHCGAVYSSCFTHDDRYLLTASEDKTVRLWDNCSGKNKVIYKGHTFPIWTVSMSAFSLYFATGSHDRTARLWTLERTYPLRTFAGHHSDVESVAFHGNASYLATADKNIRIWDINSGKTVRLMLGHWASVHCLSFSPNGKHLVSSGEDGRIRMWDISSGVLIKEMRGHNGAVYSLDFSTDGSMLASGGRDSCLRVWNTRTSQTATTRNNTDTNDETHNPDFIGKWHFSSGPIHAVKFESNNLLQCVVVDS